MATLPNRLFIFGVNHKFNSVIAELANFVKALKGKKVLYVELKPEAITNLPNLSTIKLYEWAKNEIKKEHAFEDRVAFQLLAAEAKRMGLEVRSLDQEPQYFDEIIAKRAAKGKRASYFAHELIDTHSATDVMRYENQVKREKYWSRVLSKAPIATIALMHPGHAENVARDLGLSSNQVHLVKTPLNESAQYLIQRARTIKEHVEKERLVRKRRRAVKRTLKV